MKQRLTAAAVLVALLALATASAAGAKLDADSGRRDHGLADERRAVQLARGGRRGEPGVPAEEPGRRRERQYQSWGDYKTKFEATLAAGNAPDVIEFGGTDTPKYSAAGCARSLTKADYPNSATWLSGLAKAGVYNGRVRRPLLRRRPRRHLPHRPVQGCRDHVDAEVAGRVHGRRQHKLMAKYGGSKDPDLLGRVLPRALLAPRCRSSTTSAARSRHSRAASGSAHSTRRAR